jgi:putative endonuclease
VSRAAGDRWERLAERHLDARGLRLVCRNYRCRWGELDLVMLDGRQLVVVEVRARQASSRVAPEATVGPAKQARLVAAVRHLLGGRPALADHPVRFDVVGITLRDGDYTVRWLKDAFRS